MGNCQLQHKGTWVTQLDFLITQLFFAKYSEKTIHSWPVRAKYGGIFHELNVDLYPAVLTVTSYIKITSHSIML